MPNESVGKDLQSMCGHFYVRSLLHGIIASQNSNVCQTVSPTVLVCFFLSPGHFFATLCASFPEKLPKGSQ